MIAVYCTRKYLPRYMFALFAFLFVSRRIYDWAMFIASNYLSFNITLFGRFQDGAIPFASEGDRRLPAAKITLYIIFTSIVEKNTLLPIGTSVCTTIKLVFHSIPTRTFSRVVESVSLFCICGMHFAQIRDVA